MERFRISPDNLIIYLIAFIILSLIPLFANVYVVYILILAYLYATLVASYDILLGYTGQLAFCQGAFYGMGAYASALLATLIGVPVWLSMLISSIIVAAIAAIVGAPALRLKGAYFAITTFFFAHFVYLYFLNAVNLTGGPLGLRDIPPPEPIDGLKFESTVNYYYIILAYFIIVILLLYKLVNSNIGKILVSIREDEDLAASLGINTALYKVLAFTISAFIAGMSGALFAHYFQLLHPSTFTWLTSEMVVIITLVGGVGTIIGPVIGAGIVVFILELFRFAPELRYVMWAAILIILLLYEPKGIIGIVNKYIGGRKGE